MTLLEFIGAVVNEEKIRHKSWGEKEFIVYNKTLGTFFDEKGWQVSNVELINQYTLEGYKLVKKKLSSTVKLLFEEKKFQLVPNCMTCKKLRITNIYHCEEMNAKFPTSFDPKSFVCDCWVGDELDNEFYEKIEILDDKNGKE